jgi:hypothetical protein
MLDCLIASFFPVVLHDVDHGTKNKLIFQLNRTLTMTMSSVCCKYMLLIVRVLGRRS